MHPFLSKRTDIVPLVLFRIVLGALLAYQSFYYIYDGWVKRNLLDPEFTFAHIGFEWLQPLPGNGMHIWFIAMGVAATGVMMGFFYRTSLSVFLVLWTLVYWMQKTTYNNHHYLVILICIIMLFLPAQRYLSLDSHRTGKKSLSMPNWCRWILVTQIGIVYFFAGVAKLYPGWLDGTFSGIALSKYGDGIPIFQQHWLHLAVAWGGLLFDLCIVPLLLWKTTRIWAFVVFVFFHTFNSLTLDIGIFPFLAMGTALFFFPPQSVRSFFIPNKLAEGSSATDSRHNKTALYCFALPFLTIQLLLPLRHWIIEGDVLWTEEGHRLSWRMMLRDRKGTVRFTVVDLKTGDTIACDLEKKLTKLQLKALSTHPDMIWQMAQRIRTEMDKKGKDVAVYADAQVSVNRQPKRALIDPKTDLAQAEWDYLGHCDWILLYD